MRRPLLPVLLLAASALPGCAIDHPLHERGWLGGETRSVITGFGPFSLGQGRHHHAVWGVPEGLDAESGVLVIDPGEGTPLAAAGVERGDLLYSMGGEPIDGAESFRDAVEALAPGTTVPIELWRDGELMLAEPVAGTESYRVENSLSIFLGFSLSRVDVWPFDDGIDVLGLIVVKDHDHRYDSGTVTSGYVRQMTGDPARQYGQQEQFEIKIVPLGVTLGKRVEAQAAWSDD